MAYCEMHHTEYPDNLWCPMCVIDEDLYLEELASEESKMLDKMSKLPLVTEIRID